MAEIDEIVYSSAADKLITERVAELKREIGNMQRTIAAAQAELDDLLQDSVKIKEKRDKADELKEKEEKAARDAAEQAARDAESQVNTGTDGAAGSEDLQNTDQTGAAATDEVSTGETSSPKTGAL